MKFENRLGFYIVNKDYLEYLHKYDYEVQYNSEYKKKIKPHLGIIVENENNQTFLIPSTSPKINIRTSKRMCSNITKFITKIIN